MLCEFASGVRGTFEASRTIVGPESQMAFEVYGTKGALSWNLEKLNELQVYLMEDELHSGYRTVFGGDRFPYHGNFVPGSANGIGFEDLVVIEDFEFMRSLAARRQARAGLRGRAGVRARAAGAAGVGALRALGGRVTISTATVGMGVIGVGRIGRMHADLLAREVPGATLVAVHDAEPGGGGVDRRPRVRAGRAAGRPRRRRRGDLLEHRDARRPDRGRRGRGQGDLLREADLARPRRGRPRAGGGRRGRRAVPDRLQPPLRPRPPGRATRR